MRARRMWTLLALALLFAAIGGCSAAPVPTVSTSDELVPLTLAVSRECLCATVYLAEANGAFLDAGLDVTVIEYASSQSCMEALLNGEVDAATSADTPIVFAALDDTDFDVVATLASSSNDIKVVVRADRAVSHPRDLRGKCVATAPGTAAHAFLATFLSRHGLAADDVNLCLVPFETIVEGLADGTYGAAALREPFVGEIREALGDEVVVFEEPGLYRKTMNLCVDSRLDTDTRTRLLSALIASEPTSGEVCEQAVSVVAEKLGQDQTLTCEALCSGEYRLRLDQALILALEDQARWAIASELTDATRTPDFLSRFDLTPLDELDPVRIQVIR